MKKIISFSMAAIVAMGAILASCAKELEVNTPGEVPVIEEENLVTLSTTVGFSAPESKALAADGVKTFAIGETMAVVYTNTSGDSVTAVSAALTDADLAEGNKSATFTFELADPDKTKDITYIYPASMASDDGTVNYDALNMQDGTLATLSSNLDLATYSAAWDGTSLPSGTLVNQLAICAYTLKSSDGSSEITGSITSLTVSDGTNTYTVARSAAAGPIYVAIRPTSGANISYTASNGSTIYTKSVTGKTYEAGQIYPLGLKMVPALPLNKALTEEEKGKVIGANGFIYDTKAAATAAGTSAVAMIAYVGSETGDADHTRGLAIALEDESGMMTWTEAKTACEGKTPVSGAAWHLPSQDQWKAMLRANGSDTFCTGLKDAITGAGGKAMEYNTTYWTSSEVNGSEAYTMYINTTDIVTFVSGHTLSNNKLSVRACLAFGDDNHPINKNTSGDKGKVVAADGYIYDTNAAAINAGTYGLAVIAWISPVDYGDFMAIALSDENCGPTEWDSAQSAIDSKVAITGTTWCLPSEYQWKSMLSANGGSETSCSGLNTLITNAGGSSFGVSAWWTSTNDGDHATRVKADKSSNCSYKSVYKSSHLRVRAMLVYTKSDI